MHRKVLIFGFLILMFSSLFVTNCFAKIDTEIYVNGIKLSTDVSPEIINDYTYVPIRSIGEILGFDVNYDEVAEKVTMNQKVLGVNIIMTVNDTKALVNNQEVTMPSSAVIVSGRTLVPVRFVSEALKSKVSWTPGYEDEYGISPNVVDIYSSYPVKLRSGNASISTECYSQTYNLSGGIYGGDGVTIDYDTIIPQFSGMKDSKFEALLNDRFKSSYLNIKNDTEKTYEELKTTSEDQRYSYSDSSYYTIENDSNNILSITEGGYYYSGGAHGMPHLTDVNIDFNNSKILTLTDLFKENANYEQKLLQEMNSLRVSLATSQEYEEVDEVTFLPDEYSFYFQNGNLVIFYPPYDLACYARGFVYFEIPLQNLSGYIKEEYINIK